MSDLTKCASCGLPGHRYGRNEGMDRYDPMACINQLRGVLEDLLANGQRVEPDYEAALAEYLRLRWAENGMGPYAEELADVVLPNGVTVPRISNFEEAKRIVDAAIGDKLLIDPTNGEEKG